MGSFTELDFPLTGLGPLSAAVRTLGFESFAQVTEYVRALPYGRVADEEDRLAVLHKCRGTCSSKHRFLAALARECGHTDVVLTLGLYLLSERNTPGVGRVLAAAGLDAIPEAHCYLTYQGQRFDFTGLGPGQLSPFDSLIEERAVSPDDLPLVKPRYHREAIAQWAATVGLEFERAWQLREECIELLAAPMGNPEAREKD